MKVEIYGAEWCSACKTAVAFCEGKNIDYDYIDIDDTSNLKELEKRVGKQVRNVPQIFLNGEHIPDGLKDLNKRIN